MLNFNFRLQLVSDHDGLKIISHIVHLCSNKSQLEWGLVCIFTILCPVSLIFLPLTPPPPPFPWEHEIKQVKSRNLDSRLSLTKGD